MKKGSRPQAASFDVRDILERGVEPLDAIDLDGEVGSGLEIRLVEGTVEHGLLGIGGEVAVGIQSEGGGQGLALNGEGGGVEDLDGAVSQTGLDLGELLSGAGGGGIAAAAQRRRQRQYGQDQSQKLFQQGSLLPFAFCTGCGPAPFLLCMSLYTIAAKIHMICASDRYFFSSSRRARQSGR